MNTYRIIRAAMAGEELDRFIDEREFEAVLLLLGIMIGFPGVAPDVFRGLKRTERASWSDLVAAMDPADDMVDSFYSNDLRFRLTEADALNWRNLCRALRTVNERRSEPPRQDDLVHSREWVDDVRRYSFRAGHVVSTLARRN